MLNPPIARTDLELGEAAVAGYDALEMAASFAALQLLPENACLLGRLEAAASIAASLAPEPDQPAPSSGRLRTILSSPPFSEALAVNDPRYDDVLTEEVGFHGGSYLVSAGWPPRRPTSLSC